MVRGTNSCSICPVCGFLVIELNGLAVEFNRLIPIVGGERLVAFALRDDSLLLWSCHSYIRAERELLSK